MGQRTGRRTKADGELFISPSLMTDEKSWISNAWTCKHVVCSGTKIDCFILPRTACPQPHALLHNTDLAGEVQESTLRSVECKTGGTCKEKCHLKWWLEKQAGCVSLFHVVNEVSLTIFLKVCFGTEEGMSLSLASLLQILKVNRIVAIFISRHEFLF